jgi:hypothetical protein
MAISSNRWGIAQRITPEPVTQSAPVLSSFVVCPVVSPFAGGPMVSPMAIYQMAYEQALIDGRSASSSSSGRRGRWDSSLGGAAGDQN